MPKVKGKDVSSVPKNRGKEKATLGSNRGRGSTRSSGSQKQRSTSQSTAADTTSQPIAPPASSALPDTELVLFCVADDESAPFSVTVPSNQTVDFLKKKINEELKLDTPSNGLTLWKVSIPLLYGDDDEDDNDNNDEDHEDNNDDNDEPIDLSKITKKKILKAVNHIVSAVFGNNPDRNTIHVFVQKPKQGNSAGLFSHSHELVSERLSYYPCALFTSFSFVSNSPETRPRR